MIAVGIQLIYGLNPVPIVYSAHLSATSEFKVCAFLLRCLQIAVWAAKVLVEEAA